MMCIYKKNLCLHLNPHFIHAPVISSTTCFNVSPHIFKQHLCVHAPLGDPALYKREVMGIHSPITYTYTTLVGMGQHLVM